LDVELIEKPKKKMRPRSELFEEAEAALAGSFSEALAEIEDTESEVTETID
jgi:hypothetical protein